METQSGYTSSFVQGKQGENGKNAPLTYYGTYMVVIGDLSASTSTTDLYIDSSCVGIVYYKNTQREPIAGDYCIYTANDSEIILYEVTDIDVSTLCTNVKEIDRFLITDNIKRDSGGLVVSITFESFEKSYEIYKKDIIADTTRLSYYNDTTQEEEPINSNNLDDFLMRAYGTEPPSSQYINIEHRVTIKTFGNLKFDSAFNTLETITESNKFIRAYTLTLNNEYDKKYKVILDFVHKYETAQNTSNICSMFETNDSNLGNAVPNCIPTCYGNMYSYEKNRNYNNENLQSFTITLKDWDDGDNNEHNVNVKDFFIYNKTVNDENYDCYAYIMIEETSGISQKYLIGKIDSIDELGLKISNGSNISSD